MATNTPSRPSNRAVKTCTECKQVKLRCDSKVKFPAPCSRCEARHLHCTVDSSFRRLPARRRVEEMARELEVLRSKQNEENGQASTVSPSVGDVTQSSPDNSVDPVTVAKFDYSHVHRFKEFALGDVIVDRDSVVQALKIFTSTFYPHFPVMYPTASVTTLYQSSPLLFWTIITIVVARQVNPSHLEIWLRLRDPYLDRIRNESTKSPLSLSTIQALLYLIIWPLPVDRQTHDPTWLYCGLTLNASLYMGLHTYKKPLVSLRSIGVRAGSVGTRGNTWLGCFLCSTTYSMLKGLPPLITNRADLETVERFARERPLSREFIHQVMVQHTVAKFTHVLNDSGSALSYSLVQLVETELDGLKTRFPTDFTPRAEINLLTAKLHMYAMAIIRMYADPALRDILLKRGFSAAIRIVYLCNQGVTYFSDDFPDLPASYISRTIPKHYWLSLVFSCVFLLRYFALNLKATAEEQELARNHLALAHKTFVNGVTDDPRDERTRGAYFLEVLSRQQPVDIENSKLRVDDRMGASLMYDAVTANHEIRNIDTETDDYEQTEERAETQAEAVPNVVVEQPSEQAPPIDSGSFSSFELDPNSMASFDPMEFQLPNDLWGNDIWGMFDAGLSELNNVNNFNPYNPPAI